MAEVPNETPGTEIAKYNPFLHDHKSTRELLELIQQQNHEALEKAGFFVHFLDALRSVSYFSPDALIVVKQATYDNIRTIYATLRQSHPENKENPTVRVGEEYQGMRYPTPPFNSDDLDIAIEQLDNLQTMKKLGMLSIDSSLSFPEFPTTHTF